MASVGCHTAQHQTLQKKHVDVDVCNGAQQSAAHLATAQATTTVSTPLTPGVPRNSGPAPVLSVG